ncbi:MAG: biotin--[acetyl-CoA-carboxylase] ligase [Anaerolinea sp.]|nr:biotin--[acetyl-CoA-carboxylase] ligase [Anaerolinea sp.]
MGVELEETAVLAALQTKWMGRSYQYLPQVNSTNTLLREMAQVKAGLLLPDGMVVLTDYQSAGRGRMVRRWEAPFGTSLLFSVFLRPNWPAAQAPWLTMIAALAVAEAIEQVTAVTVGIKWPNDVVIDQGGVWHKVSGILSEGDVDEHGRLAWAILGIGVNVNVTAVQLPAANTPPTSLLAAGGQPVSRLALFMALLARLEQHYETAVLGQSPQPAWNRRLVTIGQPVTATQFGDGKIVQGVAIGTDEGGQLLVRDSAGVLHQVAAGDVTLRRS